MGQQNQKKSKHFKKFYCASVHESSEGLNSSLAQSCCRLRLAKGWPEAANGTFLNFCQKLCFYAMSLAPEMLASQSRAPKTRIWVKNAKNSWDKKWPVCPEPRARKPSLKCKNTLPLWCRQWKTQPKKKFFFNLRYKTCWINRGFEHLSSCWQDVALQTF